MGSLTVPHEAARDMNKKNILIVEDDSDIRELVRQTVAKEGWTAGDAANGRLAMEKIRKTHPDLIVLDLMLPELDGKELCRILKSNVETSSIPIIMLTAKSSEIDRIVGFELGADDYMAKPFSPRELILRMKAIFNRMEYISHSGKVVRGNHFDVDFEKRIARIGGKPVDLTKIEFDLFETLLKRPGIVFSRDKLLEQALGIDAYVESRTIDMHISHLREKLGSAGKFIETVRGVGYRLSENALKT